MPAALHLHLLLLLLLLLLRGRDLLLLLLLLLKAQYNACPVVELLLLLECVLRSMGLSDQPRQRALSRLRPLCDGLQGPRVLLWRLADGG